MGIDNKVTSWDCGKSVSYDFCMDSGKACAGERGQSGAGNATCWEVGYDNSMTEVVLRQYDPTDVGAVTIFSDVKCRGAAARFEASPDGSKKKDYTRTDLLRKNLKNDKAASAFIP